MKGLLEISKTPFSGLFKGSGAIRSLSCAVRGNHDPYFAVFAVVSVRRMLYTEISRTGMASRGSKHEHGSGRREKTQK
jgi:hypothetical protein